MIYIYEVYREKSFSKAAKNLFISQPSLSASVRRIESKIGYPIFDRSTNPVSLTECGEEYIRCILKIMDIQEGFENYVNLLGSLKTGTLKIGGSNFFISYILPPLLAKFMDLYPHISVDLTEANTGYLQELLFQGALDLVIDNTTFPPQNFVELVYREETILLAVPREFLDREIFKTFSLSQEDVLHHRHLRNDCPAADLHLFESMPFILQKAGNSTREKADCMIKHSRISPRVLLQVDQQQSAYNITYSGMGLSFLSDTLIKNVKKDTRTCFFRLNNEFSRRHISFYYKKGKNITRVMAEFLRICDLDIHP